MVLLKDYVAAKWNLQNMTEKDVIVLNFQPRPGPGTHSKKLKGKKVLPFSVRSRKSGWGLFGRWTLLKFKKEVDGTDELE